MSYSSKNNSRVPRNDFAGVARQITNNKEPSNNYPFKSQNPAKDSDSELDCIARKCTPLAADLAS